ncbi:hypothetical protein HGA64_00220 [Candidatus Falkowbacteria bacterium]|nr:hypothetical protein [Candidatus Falkowbacteria bacterium]
MKTRLDLKQWPIMSGVNENNSGDITWPLAGRRLPPMVSAGTRAAEEALQNSKVSDYIGQDNLGFAKSFIRALSGLDDKFLEKEDLSFHTVASKYLFWPLVAFSCSAGSRYWLGTTAPGFCAGRLWADKLNLFCQKVELKAENDFLFPVDSLNKSLRLLIVNYPHGLSGKIAPVEWLRDLCSYCQANDLRLVNWGALLNQKIIGNSLAVLSVDYPDLSWLECYSLTETVDESWSRVSVVGSKDFVSDLKVVSMLHDNPLFLPSASGLIAAVNEGRSELLTIRNTQAKKLKCLVRTMSACGLKLATMPECGNFSLWHLPKKIFGEDITGSKMFNQLMLDNLGIDGLAFKHYVAYSALELDGSTRQWTEKLANALRGCNPIY